MKTRLQMIDGLINGTLTEAEEALALANPNVTKAVEYRNKLARKKRTPQKKKEK